MQTPKHNYRRGTEHTNAKLTDLEVRKLKAEIDKREAFREALKGLSNRDLGKKYGVSPSVIGDIAQGIAWKHI